MKTGLAILAAAGLALLAGEAAAQSCAPDPDNRCTVRFADDPNDWIARLFPGAGGVVVCDGIPASTVQYDTYSWSGGYVYGCSTTLSCAAVQAGGDSQAYNKFCP